MMRMQIGEAFEIRGMVVAGILGVGFLVCGGVLVGVWWVWRFWRGWSGRGGV